MKRTNVLSGPRSSWFVVSFFLSSLISVSSPLSQWPSCTPFTFPSRWLNHNWNSSTTKFTFTPSHFITSTIWSSFPVRPFLSLSLFLLFCSIHGFSTNFLLSSRSILILTFPLNHLSFYNSSLPSFIGSCEERRNCWPSLKWALLLDMIYQ